MVEIKDNTAKITIFDETVTTLLIFKDGDFSQELPVPQGQNYGELSNLAAGSYAVLHIDSDLNQKAKDTFTI